MRLRVLLGFSLMVAFIQNGCILQPGTIEEEDGGDKGEADADTDTDGDTDTDTHTGSDTNTDTHTGIDTDVDSDADTDAGGDSESDGDADADSDSDAETDADSDAESYADTDIDTDTDGDSDTKNDADTDTESQASDTTPACSGCLIEGKCYDADENHPDNECRYCDVFRDEYGWSNRSDTVTCDDGLWCNGDDMCDGEGNCVHEYLSGNRCSSLEGACVSTICNESANNCFAPTNTVCDEWTEYQCLPEDECGATVQKMDYSQLCSGSSLECDGDIEENKIIDKCGDNELCRSDDSSALCQPSFRCECEANGNWYDPESQLCWRDPPSTELMTWDEANLYCNDAWRMPTIAELITSIRGCQDGTEGNAVDLSRCVMNPPDCAENGYCEASTECNMCDIGEGPGSSPDRCYWDSDLTGACSTEHWSSTRYSFKSSERWYVRFSSATVWHAPFPTLLSVRCVRSEP